MQVETASIDSGPPHRLRSVGAVVVGFVVVVALSLGTDQVFHALEIYPPWGEPMNDHPLLALALCYRIVYQVLGSYLTARLAPRNPMRHVWVMGFIGLALSIVGAIGAIAAEMGPSWYPIALAVSALPCAWLGGRLFVGVVRCEEALNRRAAQSSELRDQNSEIKTQRSGLRDQDSEIRV